MRAEFIDMFKEKRHTALPMTLNDSFYSKLDYLMVFQIFIYLTIYQQKYSDAKMNKIGTIQKDIDEVSSIMKNNIGIL